MSRLKGLWQRYLMWRRAEVVSTPRNPKVINKIAANEGDITATRAANVGPSHGR